MKKNIDAQCPNCESNKIYKFNLILIVFCVFAMATIVCFLIALVPGSRTPAVLALASMFAITLAFSSKLIIGTVKNRNIVQLRCSECGSLFAIEKKCLKYKEIENNEEKE